MFPIHFLFDKNSTAVSALVSVWTEGKIISLAQYLQLEGTGAYGPLLLAPAEGLGGPSGPLICGEIYFNN